MTGTPANLSSAQMLSAFRSGWDHTWKNEPHAGYYIGRYHDGYTELRVVRSVKANTEGYLSECAAGEPGEFITRGKNLMSGYVSQSGAGDPFTSAEDGGWYTGLGDVGFWLPAPDNPQARSQSVVHNLYRGA